MMKEQLKEKTKESLASVLPITVIVFLLSATVVPMETGTLLLFLIGAMLLIVGMGIFQLGAELAMTPLGQSIGSRMIKGNKLWATVLICFFRARSSRLPNRICKCWQIRSLPSPTMY